MTEDNLALKLTEVDQRGRSNTRRIETLEQKVDDLTRLTSAMEVMASEQKHLSDAIGDVKDSVFCLDKKVEAIESKPAKRWETAVEKVIFAVIGAAAAYIIARLGL